MLLDCIKNALGNARLHAHGLEPVLSTVIGRNAPVRCGLPRELLEAVLEGA
jgi:hypothetical protein